MRPWKEDLNFSSNIATMAGNFTVVAGTFLGWGLPGGARHIIQCIIDPRFLNDIL